MSIETEAARKPATARDVDHEDMGPVCVDAKEFFEQRARVAIRRVLGEWLASISITPIELLHHPDHLARLENAGSVLQGAVQRVGRSHAQATGKTMHNRMRELYDLTDAVILRVRKDAQAKRLPSLANDDVDGLARKLADKPEAGYLFYAALAARLAEIKTLDDKLQLLVQFLEQARESVPFLDQLIAEYLDDVGAITDLLGEQPNLGGAVLQMAALAQGRFVEMEALPAGYQRLADLILKQKMPACRAAITRRIVRTLEGRQPLLDGDVYREVCFNTELEPLLRDHDGNYIGGTAMQKAMRARLARYLQPSKLLSVLEETETVVEQLERLLEMAPGITDEESRKDFAIFLVDVVESPVNKEFLKDSSEKTGAAHLLQLANLQHKVYHLPLPTRPKEKITTKLDQFSVVILKKTEMLRTVKPTDSDFTKRILMLLNLCANESLTQGDTSTLVRKRVTAYVKAPGFLEDFIKASGAGDGGKQRLMLLHKLLSAVGLAGPEI